MHFWFVRFRLAAKRWRDDYVRMSKRGKLVPAVVVRNEQILADFKQFSKLVEAGTYHRMQFVEWLRERFKDMAPQS
ncbi:SHS2 domain-containing protein [Paraburkholderia sp. GAS334]